MILKPLYFEKEKSNFQLLAKCLMGTTKRSTLTLSSNIWLVTTPNVQSATLESLGNNTLNIR